MIRKVIGIDIGKRRMYYCVTNEEGEILEEAAVLNTKSGFEELLELIQKHNCEIIFEATGVYSRRWQYFLELNQMDYVRMNPLQAKKEMDTLRNTKNDRVDARKLAVLQLQHHYQPTYIEDEVYRELRRKGRFYQLINQEKASAKNRVKRLVEETFSNVAAVLNPTTEQLSQVMAVIPHAEILKTKTDDELVALLAETIKQEPTRRRLVQVIRQAASTASVAVPVDSFAVKELRYWAKQVLELDQLKNDIVDDMLAGAGDLEEVDILTSIPGIGNALGINLLAELGDIKRFATPQKLTAFVGLDVRFSDSGEVKTSGFISKRGSSTARKTLYLAFLKIIMMDKTEQFELTRWYRRRTRDMTGNKKKIIVGGMDRTLRLIYHLVTHHERFQLA